jgi:phosphate/sulfate permease
MLNFDWANGISTETAKAIIIGIFVLIGIAVSFLPKKYIYAGVEDPHWYHNLKLWAIGALAIIAGTYLYF